MPYWLLWVIVAAIGIVVGWLLHTAMRYTQGPHIMASILAGLLGSVIGAFIVAPYAIPAATSLLTMRFVWAFIVSIFLSAIVETLFAGSRPGRVYTS